MKNKIKGSVWVIRDTDGNPINDIDTDMIFHNKHLAITELSEMAKYAFGNLDNWKDFPQKVQNGDILIVGENFGAGSSRQQAVDCFIALGIQTIVGESFGAIYFRNTVNAGLPIFIAPKIADSDIKTGDEIEINLDSGKIFDITQNIELPSAKPLTDVQRQIMSAGELLKLAQKMR
ncbi:3-isopropylmalate dehydratase [bacterium]|nr:3-isopropylmalate dehydratase [bacterium]